MATTVTRVETDTMSGTGYLETTITISRHRGAWGDPIPERGDVPLDVLEALAAWLGVTP